MAWHTVRGCWQKAAYLNEREAQLAVSENEARYKQKFRYYVCSDREREHYHLTRVK